MTATPFSIRPVRAEELKPWLDLANQHRHWQEDVPGFLFEETLRPAGEPALRLGAWAAEGELAGMAQASLSEDGSPFTDRAQGFVAVAAAYRRQGLGTRLAADVDRFAATAGVRWLETETLERELGASLPLLRNRPTGFILPVRGLLPSAGAGFVVALCGDMQRMPGLGKTPAFQNIDVDAQGRTIGLF